MQETRADDMARLAKQFIEAWNTQDVEEVLACYTDDVVYRDPNTQGTVEGADAMRRYLTKLFAGWQMCWSVRDLYPLADGNGASVLWRASFRPIDGDKTVEVEGMDIVLLRDGRIAHNEVQFDRAALATLS